MDITSLVLAEAPRQGASQRGWARCTTGDGRGADDVGLGNGEMDMGEYEKERRTTDG